MKFVANEFYITNDVGLKRKPKGGLRYVWIGRRKSENGKEVDPAYLGTIDSKAQARKLIKILKETKFYK